MREISWKQKKRQWLGGVDFFAQTEHVPEDDLPKLFLEIKNEKKYIAGPG